MKKHSTDIVSLIFGAVFISVAGWWLAGRFLDLEIDVPHLGWIAAGSLIVLGLLGVWGSLRRAETTTTPDAGTLPAVSAPAEAGPDSDPTREL